MDKIIKIISLDIIPIVNKIRLYQEKSERINENDSLKIKKYFKELLLNLNALVLLYPKSSLLVNSLKKDLESFDFLNFKTFKSSNVALNYTPPLNNEFSFFIGVVKSQNSLPPRNNFFECFLTYREDPKNNNILYSDYPHPENICSSSKLILGSKGISQGNCVVFFPENIYGNLNLKKQKYALFFFNKFRQIFKEITIPNVKKIILKEDILSLKLSNKEFYQARCVWGYLHDYFHHQGPKPFNKNIKLKMNWFVGLLEEVKCDCQTIIECYRNKNIPYRKEIIEFVLFDRMFRYPFQLDNLTNFDSGTGFFIFNFLIKNNAIQKQSTKYTLNLEKTIYNMERLVNKILSIEEKTDEGLIKELSEALISNYMKVSNSKNRKITNVKEFEPLLHLKLNTKTYITNYNFLEKTSYY